MIIQMLMSRFQAIRYHKPALVGLFSRLILRSAQAFRSMRLASSPRYIYTDHEAALIRSLEKQGFCFCCLDLRL